MALNNPQNPVCLKWVGGNVMSFAYHVFLLNSCVNNPRNQENQYKENARSERMLPGPASAHRLLSTTA